MVAAADPCRGPLSVSDFVAREHVMVAYRETGHGEIDRQLASQGLARRVRFATQNFSTFPLLLTTLPLFATVPQGWRSAGRRSMRCARTLRR